MALAAMTALSGAEDRDLAETIFAEALDPDDPLGSMTQIAAGFQRCAMALLALAAAATGRSAAEILQQLALEAESRDLWRA